MSSRKEGKGKQEGKQKNNCDFALALSIFPKNALKQMGQRVYLPTKVVRLSEPGYQAKISMQYHHIPVHHIMQFVEHFYYMVRFV